MCKFSFVHHNCNSTRFILTVFISSIWSSELLCAVYFREAVCRLAEEGSSLGSLNSILIQLNSVHFLKRCFIVIQFQNILSLSPKSSACHSFTFYNKSSRSHVAFMCTSPRDSQPKFYAHFSCAYIRKAF
jgi:hypothetical protein